VYGGTNPLFLNNGEGEFTQDASTPISSPARNTRALRFADYDADGDVDLVVGDCCGQGAEFYQNTGGTFTKVSLGFSGGGDIQDWAWGDVNGDGHLDLVQGKYGAPNLLYLNDGNGGMSLSNALSSPQRATYAVSLADLDNDGDLDLVVANYNDVQQGGGENEIYLNEQGSFVAMTGSPFTASTANGRALGLGDFDGDGGIDIYVGNANGQNVLYLNPVPPSGAIVELAGEAPKIAFGTPGAPTCEFSLNKAASRLESSCDIHTPQGRRLDDEYDAKSAIAALKAEIAELSKAVNKLNKPAANATTLVETTD